MGWLIVPGMWAFFFSIFIVTEMWAFLLLVPRCGLLPFDYLGFFWGFCTMGILFCSILLSTMEDAIYFGITGFLAGSGGLELVVSPHVCCLFWD